MSLGKVLDNISPNKDERIELNRKVKSFLKLTKNKDITFFVGGSYAKDTYLRGNIDIDVFAKFNYKEYRYDKDISKKLLKFLKSKFKGVKTIHGSRDYFNLEYEGLKFEIIPVLGIKKTKDALNIMDVSPLHVKYIKKRARRKKEDVRLLKQFCIANELYGAESHIKGFSGYVLELLVIYYGSFEKVVKSAKEWKEQETLCFKGNKEEKLSKLNKSKKSSLIIFDPVQEERNASAALSKKNYEKFISLCKAYNGNNSFFVKKEVLLHKLKGYLIFDIKPLDGKQDIIAAKLLSLLERVKKEFELNEFNIKNYGWKFDKEIYFWFKTERIPEHKIHSGPKVSDKENVEAFKNKWKRIKVYKGRVYTTIERKFYEPLQFSKHLIKESWFKEKVKSVKIYLQE